MAEIRIAKEADKLDKNPGGRPKTSPEAGEVSKAPTLKEIGLDDRRLSEWRKMAAAGEAVVDEALQDALAEGRVPTKADINKKVRGTQGTGDNEWYTPANYVELARQVLGLIDLDPASSAQAQSTVCAKQYFTKELDGLAHPWNGAVWLNPPYAQPFIEQFANKLIAEVSAGRVTSAIMLTHNYTDTAWFQKLIAAASAICFTKGRIRFQAPSGLLASPTQGQAFFYFGSAPALFANTFAEVGAVVSRVRFNEPHESSSACAS